MPIEHLGTLSDRPKCGARTKSGAPCQAVAVKGVGRCRMHGGGKALVRRYNERLKSTRGPKTRETLLRRLGRTQRNKLRQYDKPSVAPTALTSKAKSLQARVHTRMIKDRNFAKRQSRWLKAVQAVRAYRLDDIYTRLQEGLLGDLGIPTDALRRIADELALDTSEREIFLNVALDQ